MDALWIVAGAAVMALLFWAWRAQQNKFADEMFGGVIPGLTPTGSQPELRGPVPSGHEYNGEMAVAFNPPRGVRPGLAGTVVDGKPENRDVMATIVDLAARGHLMITVVEDAAARGGKDWELRATDTPPANDEPEPGEQELLRTLFMAGSPVRLSELPRQRNFAFNDYQYLLANESYERGYFRHVTGIHPVRMVWIAAGLLLLLGLGMGSMPLLAAGGAAALGGALIGTRTAQRPVRTAEGTALRVQTLGFKKYLETAEIEQFSYEEAAGIFSKYLPWAIVLGVASHWVKLFGDLAAKAHAEGYEDDFDLLWLGVMGWGVHDAMFSLALFSAMDGFDAGGLDAGGFGDAFDGASFGDAFGGDAGGMFDSGTIDGLGADAGGSFGDFGGNDFSSVDSGSSWGSDFGGGGEGGGWGDFGGGGDFGGFGGD